MLDSLDRLGYSVSENDPNADIGLVFDQPHNSKFYGNQYKILYHPWESTLLLPGWADIMNQCDEIWTPSPMIANWYRRYNGIEVPVYVYEHGIEHCWEPREREIDDEIRFLHIGAEAARKGGWDLPPIMSTLFANTGINAKLTLKMDKQHWNRIPELGRTRYLNMKLSFEQLQDLYYDHHIYVYPSYGEGFGLTPLQAMATGMPTITVPGWAPYRTFLDSNLTVGHDLRTSKWPEIHPGKMMRPRYDDLKNAMLYAAENYEQVSSYAMETAREIHSYYDWDRLTKQTFSALERRLGFS